MTELEIPYEVVSDDELQAIEQAMEIAAAAIRARPANLCSTKPENKIAAPTKRDAEEMENSIVPQNLFGERHQPSCLTAKQLLRIEREKAAALERKKKAARKVWKCYTCKESFGYELRGYYSQYFDSGCCKNCEDCCDCNIPMYNRNGRDRWGGRDFGMCRSCYGNREDDYVCIECSGCSTCCACQCFKCGREAGDFDDFGVKCDVCGGCQKCCTHGLGAYWCRTCENSTDEFGEEYSWRCENENCQGCRGCCECQNSAEDEDEDEDEESETDKDGSEEVGEE